MLRNTDDLLFNKHTFPLYPTSLLFNKHNTFLLHPANMSDFSLSTSDSSSSVSDDSSSLCVSDDSCSNQVKQTPITRQSNRKNTENNQKLSALELFIQISRTIAAATEHQLLTYEGVDSETGFEVADSLDEDGGVEAVGHR